MELSLTLSGIWVWSEQARDFSYAFQVRGSRECGNSSRFPKDNKTIMDSLALITQQESSVNSLFQSRSTDQSVDLSKDKLPFSVNQMKSTRALWHLFLSLSMVVPHTFVDTCVLAAVSVSKYMKQWRVKIILKLTYACCSHTVSLSVCMCYIPGTLKFTFKFQMS